MTKKIAVLTSGGDSPGMNATIYGFVAQCLLLGYEPYIVREGYKGLIANLIEPTDFDTVKQHAQESGSFIGSSRSPEFQNDPQARERAVANLTQLGISGLLVIGGDGSYRGAEHLLRLGLPVITAPGTVDNDVASSEVTIGFSSAAQEIYDSIKKIRQTSKTHHSVMLIEVMGRNCVDLSVFAGITGLVDGIVTNQNPFQLEDFLRVIQTAHDNNQREVLFLISERTYGAKYGMNLPDLETIAQRIEQVSGFTTRTNILGYVQRGATPTFHEMILGINFGKEAARLFSENTTGVAIGSNGWSFFYKTPLLEANKKATVNRLEDIEWNNALVMRNYENEQLKRNSGQTKKDL